MKDHAVSSGRRRFAIGKKGLIILFCSVLSSDFFGKTRDFSLLRGGIML